MVTRSQARQAYQLAASALLLMPFFAATYYAAFLLRFAGEPGLRACNVFFETAIWLVAIQWLAFVWYRLHQGWTRFVGFDDLLVLVKAVTCGVLGTTAFGPAAHCSFGTRQGQVCTRSTPLDQSFATGARWR